jgi:hypothetical protein
MMYSVLSGGVPASIYTRWAPHAAPRRSAQRETSSPPSAASRGSPDTAGPCRTVGNVYPSHSVSASRSAQASYSPRSAEAVPMTQRVSLPGVTTRCPRLDNSGPARDNDGPQPAHGSQNCQAGHLRSGD